MGPRAWWQRRIGERDTELRGKMQRAKGKDILRPRSTWAKRHEQSEKVAQGKMDSGANGLKGERHKVKGACGQKT